MRFQGLEGVRLYPRIACGHIRLSSLQIARDSPFCIGSGTINISDSASASRKARPALNAGSISCRNPLVFIRYCHPSSALVYAIHRRARRSALNSSPGCLSISAKASTLLPAALGRGLHNPDVIMYLTEIGVAFSGQGAQFSLLLAGSSCSRSPVRDGRPFCSGRRG